ncbi:MAG: type II restriction endonuclease, partial [Coriobacteriia bacterium]
WLGGENEGFTEESTITWYDARASHPTRSEYRLYYKSNPVMELASESDLLVVARRPDGSLYFMVAPSASTIERQLIWLFSVPEQLGPEFRQQDMAGKRDIQIDFVVRYILEELGIEVQEADLATLDHFLEPYISSGFPTTREFSELARRISGDVYISEDPDTTLVTWMNTEERLFRRLEGFIINARLSAGFYENGGADIDAFLRFSKSVQNRRKSRVGYALEHHLSEIFRRLDLRYVRNPVTERRSRPDFIFPGIDEYTDDLFPESGLTMLGVKSTCKDRWRQVLTEAERIKQKHLFTLEPGISHYQTEEMKANSLQLVLPTQLHDTYSSSQKGWLMNLQSFIRMVMTRQESSTGSKR